MSAEGRIVTITATTTSGRLVAILADLLPGQMQPTVGAGAAIVSLGAKDASLLCAALDARGIKWSHP